MRRGTLAIALATAGDITEALELFAEAGAIREDSQSYYDLGHLPSLPDYDYGDLLLAQGKAEDALKRGQYQMLFAQMNLGGKGPGLHHVVVANLLIGRSQDVLN